MGDRRMILLVCSRMSFVTLQGLLLIQLTRWLTCHFAAAKPVLRTLYNHTQVGHHVLLRRFELRAHPEMFLSETEII